MSRGNREPLKIIVPVILDAVKRLGEKHEGQLLHLPTIVICRAANLAMRSAEGIKHRRYFSEGSTLSLTRPGSGYKVMLVPIQEAQSGKCGRAG